MKRRLDTIKGKRVVLTNNSNEIKYNEIGIIEKPNGKVEVKAHNNQGKIEDLASGSSDLIYVGIKKPFLGNTGNDSISDINRVMWNLSISDKYTNACCWYYNNDYGYEEYNSREYIIALAIPATPELPNILYGFPCSTFEQLKLEFVKQGFTEQEFDSNFYEMTKEEFLTPSPEIIDKLTLEFDNHKLVVDFAKNTYEKDGVISQITDSRVPRFNDLTSVDHGEMVCNNVKYETNTNNYVEYYERFSSDVYYDGRIKVNGVGPDPNYGNVYRADGYRHSSGIIVQVIE